MCILYQNVKQRSKTASDIEKNNCRKCTKIVFDVFVIYARVSQTFCSATHFQNGCSVRPMMGSLDDTCKRPITNLKRHFCLWRNHANEHNPRK